LVTNLQQFVHNIYEIMHLKLNMLLSNEITFVTPAYIKKTVVAPSI
jgi:hypothetical protein